MGVEGIWWAISISAFLKGTFVIILFSTGWWKKREYLFIEN
jgi:Na+-driven multidrug efflux pump